MKAVALLVSAVAFAAAPAGAYLGEVVASFRTPANLPGAVATSGNYIYVYCAGRYLPPFHTIFQINATTGATVASFASPFGSSTSGLGYEYGGYLWIGRYSSYLARCDAATGSVYSSLPVTQHSLGGGIACQGDPTRPGTLAAVISCGASPYLCTRHRTSGSLLSSFPTPILFRDPAWDYRNGVIWFPVYQSPSRTVRAYTTAGSFAASFTMPSKSSVT